MTETHLGAPRSQAVYEWVWSGDGGFAKLFPGRQLLPGSVVGEWLDHPARALSAWDLQAAGGAEDEPFHPEKVGRKGCRPRGGGR